MPGRGWLPAVVRLLYFQQIPARLIEYFLPGPGPPQLRGQRFPVACQQRNNPSRFGAKRGWDGPGLAAGALFFREFSRGFSE